ncbi:MAG: PilZ domain-containing protein [Pseudobacteriovorax sp.]|nr:PilZ domain-containing protein [Pseudobacteriovorax sp.]
MAQPKSNRDRRLKPRYKISIHVRIEAQLIGSPMKYDFISEDISESGLLIRHTGRHKVSFNKFSIIEVWLYPPESPPIFFFAKYIRFIPETQLLAIRISDIDREHADHYRIFLETHAESEVD